MEATSSLAVAPVARVWRSRGGARKVLVVALCSSAASSTRGGCGPRFQAPEEPRLATDHNGIALEETCFDGPGPHHVFLVGDWGGVGDPPVPADHRSPGTAQSRNFIVGVDDRAQQRVAAQMRKRASTSNPDYVLNVGDNFYWGGILAECGKPVSERVDMWNQFSTIFERIYAGPGLDGKQWLGVLGNHDYGGFMFTNGWDQAIAYTWGAAPGSPPASGRWMTPAQYWSAKVNYPDFSVDYFFIDSNVFNAWQFDYDVEHNICGKLHNKEDASCGETGPPSVDACQGWFEDLWQEQMQWLEDKLSLADTDWQIIVTHFPAVQFGTDNWKRLCDQYGVDLIISGHTHFQRPAGNHPGNPIAPTTHLISGGGGGITSEGIPDFNGHDDMYGFYDLTLTKDIIRAEAISHGGHTRSITEIYEWSVAKEKTFKEKVNDLDGVETTSEEPPDAFAAFLPLWASGGTSWFSMDGSVGRSCTGDGKPMELWGASSIDHCRGICENLPTCKGIQYTFAESRCSVWSSDVSGTEESEGSACLSYRKGEIAENPTPSPTKVATTLLPTTTSAAPETTLPPTQPPTSPPTSQGTPAEENVCSLDMTVLGVDFSKLSGSSGLIDAFSSAVTEAIVGVAGSAGGIRLRPGDVTLRLEQGGPPLTEAAMASQTGMSARRLTEGGVGVHATIAPPSDGTPLDEVVSAMQNPGAMGKSVVSAISDVKGIEAVSTGPISVADLAATRVGPGVASVAGTTTSPATTTRASQEPNQPGGKLVLVILLLLGALVVIAGVAVGIFFHDSIKRALGLGSPPKVDEAAQSRSRPSSPPRTAARGRVEDGFRTTVPKEKPQSVPKEKPQSVPKEKPQSVWRTMASTVSLGQQGAEPAPAPPPPTATSSRFGIW